MNGLEAAENTSVTRLFPPVGAGLYETDELPGALAPDRRVACQLLALSRRRLHLLGRLSGMWLNGPAKVGRLLLLHGCSVDAEIDGRIARADFFWRETYAQLYGLSRRPKVWAEALESLPVAAESSLRWNPEGLLATLVKEVFVDTHRAFFRGLCAGQRELPAEHRGFAHLAYIRQIIDLTRLSDEEKREILGGPTLQQIAALIGAESWSRAECLAADLLRRFPETREHQVAAADVYYAEAAGRLSQKETEASRLKDATTLAWGLYRLKRLRQDYPHNLALFERIARLHHRRAEKFAGAARLAEALADVEAALTFKPDLTEAEETRAKLESDMQQLRVQAAAGQTDNQSVFDRKVRLVRQQMGKGFRLVDNYKRSDEARAVADDLAAARGHEVWEKIGLGPLERFDLRPLALEDALQTIYHDPPTAVARIPAEWIRVSRDNPHLAALDARLISAFLAERLFGASASVVLNIPGSEPRESKMPKPLTPKAVVRGSEPFAYWVFSRQGTFLKIQCLLALIICLLAGWLFVRDYRNRQARTEAYVELTQAKERFDYAGMLDAAERFLSSPVIGRDSTIPEVEGLYSEALVRWFIEENPSSGATEARLGRYRELTGVGGFSSPSLQATVPEKSNQ